MSDYKMMSCNQCCHTGKDCDVCVSTLFFDCRSYIFLVAFDVRCESFNESTRLRISRADYSIKVIKRCNHIFFDTLRNKLMWGADVR